MPAINNAEPEDFIMLTDTATYTIADFLMVIAGSRVAQSVNLVVKNFRIARTYLG